MQSKAKYITVFFQSGYDTTISNMHRENGGYGSSPFGEDRVVGSILKIDNVVLNYDYKNADRLISLWKTPLLLKSK